MASKSIFKKIIDLEIPARIAYEDDLCMAFEDIKPNAPTHLIVIPKKEIPTVNDITVEDEAIVGHLFRVMGMMAAKQGLSGGYRVVANCGPDAGQEVMHLHFHMLAGRKFTWPPG
jgi:histidine triad (HIT) family protein